MKMKLTFVLLLFLGVGVLARFPALTSAEEEVAVNELSERHTRSASSESSEVSAGGTGGEFAMSSLKHLAKILGLNGISHIPNLVAKYYTDSLPISIEALRKSLGITTSLRQLQDTSPLYQMMKNIPIVGTIVNFMTNTLFIPINIIALVVSLVSTIIQRIYNSLPKIG